jgi:hypothetical protein
LNECLGGYGVRRGLCPTGPIHQCPRTDAKYWLYTASSNGPQIAGGSGGVRNGTGAGRDIEKIVLQIQRSRYVPTSFAFA